MMPGFRLLLKVLNTVLWKNSSEPIVIIIIANYNNYNNSLRNNRIGTAGVQALADCLKHCAIMKELEYKHNNIIIITQ